MAFFPSKIEIHIHTHNDPGEIMAELDGLNAKIDALAAKTENIGTVLVSLQDAVLGEGTQAGEILALVIELKAKIAQLEGNEALVAELRSGIASVETRIEGTTGNLNSIGTSLNTAISAVKAIIPDPVVTPPAA